MKICIGNDNGIDMNEARIKLAKIMGIKSTPISDLILNKYSFDPFNDANNDYAVLKWMRAQGDKYHFKFEATIWTYQIGDYARAACKVLGIKVYIL